MGVLMEESESIEYQYKGLVIDGHIDMAYNAVVLNRDINLPVADIRHAELTKPSIDRNAGTCWESMCHWR